jgi:hypothetical protein
MMRGNSKDSQLSRVKSAKLNQSGHSTANLDSTIASFEMASYRLDDYPNEKIEFVKFLDDNDPRLLLLVTYHLPSDTTYMKVLKIEKISGSLGHHLGDANQNYESVETGLHDHQRRGSFSYMENRPI